MYNNFVDWKEDLFLNFQKISEKFSSKLNYIMSLNDYSQYWKNNPNSRILNEKNKKDQKYKEIIFYKLGLEKKIRDILFSNKIQKNNSVDHWEILKIPVLKIGFKIQYKNKTIPVRVFCALKNNTNDFDKYTIYPLIFDLKHCFDNNKNLYKEKEGNEWKLNETQIDEINAKINKNINKNNLKNSI